MVIARETYRLFHLADYPNIYANCPKTALCILAFLVGWDDFFIVPWCHEMDGILGILFIDVFLGLFHIRQI